MTKHFFIIVGLLLFVKGCGMTSLEGLTNNYEENKSDIIALKDYYNELVPEGYLVRIRYASADEIDLFVYEPSADSEKRELLFQKWGIDPYDYVPEPQTEYDKKYHGKTNSLKLVLDQLNWTNKNFEELYLKLININCLGISNRYPTEIEYGYKGMGMFSYLVFNENLDVRLQKKYSDDCTQMFYKDNIVFSYGSGAFGSLCTSEFDRSK